MNDDWSTVEARARTHGALADPSRLSMVDMLALGDLSPSELGNRLGLDTNLVAHHVRILAEAGIVVRTPSEADRRRVYLRLDRQRVRVSMALTVPTARRVVFVCTQNAARSQLAVALWRKRSRLPVRSAGTNPAGRVHPQAIAAAHRHGLAMAAHGTAHLDDVTSDHDLLVVVCDAAHELLPATIKRLHWSVPDPVPNGTAAAFDHAIADLSPRVDHLAHALRTRSRS